MRHRAVPHPFLKWAGGKTQLADVLLGYGPPSFETYHEPFVGGGALFFRLYRERKIRRAVLSDVNAELVDTYCAVRDCVNEVMRLLAAFPHRADFYYELRARDPWSLTPPERAARMIYLNKTGYNGLYRVNRRGQFNVPFGRYKSPQYLDERNLLAVHQALQNVEIVCSPFDAVVERAARCDLVYFDPPYVPLSPTANFTAYAAGGFGLREQERLRDVCVELARRGVHVLLSNSDTPLVRALYQPPYFTTYEVFANRAINSDRAKRGKITELVITSHRIERQVRFGSAGRRTEPTLFSCFSEAGATA